MPSKETLNEGMSLITSGREHTGVRVHRIPPAVIQTGFLEILEEHECYAVRKGRSGSPRASPRELPNRTVITADCDSRSFTLVVITSLFLCLVYKPPFLLSLYGGSSMACTKFNPVQCYDRHPPEVFEYNPCLMPPPKGCGMVFVAAFR